MGDRLKGEDQYIAVAIILLDTLEGSLDHRQRSFQHLGEDSGVEEQCSSDACRLIVAPTRLKDRSNLGREGSLVTRDLVAAIIERFSLSPIQKRIPFCGEA
jgi:hypothetical protein